MTTPLLEIRNISKAYGATQALDNVSLAVYAGEVHAVVGENGAGKSTLINVVSGVVRPDVGEIRFAGRVARIDSPNTAQQLGIGTVHQELSLAELLTVAENIFAARLPSQHGFIDWKNLKVKTRAIFESLELSLDPEKKVGDLPISSRQLVEIAKALSLDAKLLLLDEPTSALSANERDALFRLIRRLRAKGIGIIYISHHLSEIISLADRITVLRDGAAVATHEAGSATPESLVKDMVGRLIASTSASKARRISKPLLETRSITSPGAFSDVSFTIHSGEIIGLAGLLGSGRSALASCLAGLRPQSKGDIFLSGERVQLTSLRQAMELGIGYIPADRKTEGLFLEMSVGDNISSASLEKFSDAVGLFDKHKRDATSHRYIQSLSIRCNGPRTRCGTLSGGNQQKVLLAKWFETRPRLLILDEPTKGVDVAAKSDIHSWLQKLAANGTAILLVTSDLPEVLALSHRILVMHREHIATSLMPDATSEQEIIAFASGLRELAT
jgi:ABC-type sugar transport system ATPase subunit